MRWIFFVKNFFSNSRHFSHLNYFLAFSMILKKKKSFFMRTREAYIIHFQLHRNLYHIDLLRCVFFLGYFEILIFLARLFAWFFQLKIISCLFCRRMRLRAFQKIIYIYIISDFFVILPPKKKIISYGLILARIFVLISWPLFPSLFSVIIFLTS